MLTLQGCKGAAVSPAKDDAVLAVVNGQNLTVGDFKAFTKYSIPPEEALKKAALQKMIQNRLFSAVALHRGLNADPDFNARLTFYYASVLPNVLKAEIAKGITVGEAEVPKGAVSDAPVLELYQIVVPTVEEAGVAMRDIRGGASFESVAAKRSQGISAKGGGYLGQVDLGTDIYSPGVKAVLNKLKPGEVSPIVKTDLGYSIFKLKAKKEQSQARKESLESALEGLKKRKVEEEYDKLKKKLRSEAKVEYNQKLLAGDFSQEWAAKVNGVTININPGVLKKEDEFSHGPHQSMDVNSVFYSLQSLVDEILLADEARKRGLDKEPHISRMAKFEEESILAGLLLEKGLGAFEPSDQEIKEYYDKYKDRFIRKTTLRLRRILAPSKAEAEKAMAELKSGKDFASVAGKRSIDRSKLAGGDMGWIEAERLSKSLKGPLSSLKAGQTSGIIQTRYGFEIFRVEQRLEGGIPPMAELMDKLRNRVALQKRSEAVEALYRDVYGNAKVKVDEALLKSL